MKLTQEQRDWLSLTLVPGVGTAGFVQLLARFKTAGDVLRAPFGQLREVVSENLARRISEYSAMSDVAGQEKAMGEAGASLITLEDMRYPVRLAEIYDPPLVLFVRGDLRPEDERSVAIVGTRKATPYGIRMAERFGRDLASRGITVVSGMAAGVDAAAHRGAIEAGGRTIAVLGCGVDVVYPRQNAGLMDEIIANGCVLSQFPMGMQPSKGNFPYRNRLISGLSLGTLIVEAPLRSGALITARQAAEQGREVFAVPGQLGVYNSEGPHKLIQDGAKLVQDVDDILVELEMPEVEEAVAEPAMAVPGGLTRASLEPEAAQPAVPSPPPRLSEAERSILGVLAPDGSFIDEIAAKCRLSISEALSSLTMMELKGLVRQFSGKRFAPR